jgi:hypothetical protein
VVGTIDASGDVHRLRRSDPGCKVESPRCRRHGVIDFLFVCDQDDPSAPSPLLSTTMPIDARFSRCARQVVDGRGSSFGPPTRAAIRVDASLSVPASPSSTPVDDLDTWDVAVGTKVVPRRSRLRSSGI